MIRKIHLWGAVGLCAMLAGITARGDGTIDLSHAIRVSLPSAGKFTTPDGKEGWVRRLSNETIPTPAYAKGKIFTGAGMGSRTFMALNAATGEMLWQQQTQDNGPTSPIVEEGYVSYNTESCHTETRDI